MRGNKNLKSISSKVFILERYHTIFSLTQELGDEFCGNALFLCLTATDLKTARKQKLYACKLNDITGLGHQFEIDNFSASHSFLNKLISQSSDFSKLVVYSCSSDFLPQYALRFALFENIDQILLNTNKKFVVVLYQGFQRDFFIQNMKINTDNDLNKIEFNLREIQRYWKKLISSDMKSLLIKKLMSKSINELIFSAYLNGRLSLKSLWKELLILKSLLIKKLMSKSINEFKSLAFHKIIQTLYLPFIRSDVGIHVPNNLKQQQLGIVVQIADKLVSQNKSVIILHEGLDKKILKNFKHCSLFDVLPLKLGNYSAKFFDNLQKSSGDILLKKTLNVQKQRKFADSQAGKILFFKDFFETINCSKLLTYSYGTNLARAIRAGAYLANTDSFSLMIGIYAAHDRSFPVLEPYTSFFVYGKYGQEMFLGRGVDEKNIFVTGHPEYDEIINLRSNISRTSTGCLKILVATSCIPSLDRSWLPLFENLIFHWNVDVRIRPHPSIGPDFYEEMVNKNENFSFSDGTLEEDINWSDVMLSDFSHVIVVCALLKRKIIIVNFSGDDFVLRWDLNFNIPVVRNIAELENDLKAIEKTLHDETPNTHNIEYPIEGIQCPDDGKSVKRIVAILAA